jgi:ribonuclease P protein component
MLKQKYRFHSRGGVNFVHQKGQMIRTPMMAVTFVRNERGFKRFAVVVSKKVMKSAVGRNRIRRRVYEAIRLEFPSDKPPTDYIFTIYNPGMIKIPFRELRRLIQELIERAEKQ